MVFGFQFNFVSPTYEPSLWYLLMRSLEACFEMPCPTPNPRTNALCLSGKPCCRHSLQLASTHAEVVLPVAFSRKPHKLKAYPGCPVGGMGL